MEEILHYVWKHKLLPLNELTTTDGREVEVLDPGLHNRDAGPDFFNAKVRIGDAPWKFTCAAASGTPTATTVIPNITMWCCT